MENQPEGDDPFNVVDESQGDIMISYEEFLRETLFVLQLTRSAIINFCFCVRSKGSDESQEGGIPYTFQHK
jgi:hypothetical protein